jgi:hypothetical protein
MISRLQFHPIALETTSFYQLCADKAFGLAQLQVPNRACRLPVGETAGCQPALQTLSARYFTNRSPFLSTFRGADKAVRAPGNIGHTPAPEASAFQNRKSEIGNPK